MRRRWIIPLTVILAITDLMLISGIFKLYMEAEKVQSSIFTNEVLIAGEEIVNRIDALLKGDTISFLPAAIAAKPDSLHRADTAKIIYQKHSKKFILDSTETPLGVIKTTISYAKNNIVKTTHDTAYFDANYRKIFPYMPFWTTGLPNDATNINPYRAKKLNVDFIEMDSATIALLNPDYLYRIIGEALKNQTIITQYDFALYNAFTTRFVIPPSAAPTEIMLSSEHVFSLKNSEKFVAPHYLILYFPNERAVYFQRMGILMAFIIAFLCVLFIISFVTLYFLHRQRRISDIRTDFINNITHEFKTPISTITLACEGLTDPNLKEETDLKETYISIIKEENNRLKIMVSNILQLAQLNKGQLKMQMESFDVHALIQKVADAISLQISVAQGELSLDLAATNPSIYGDEAHIENVIINMVENAIKYAKERPIIRISTRNIKRHFELSVKDEGIGIARKNLKRIFHEFYRASSGNIHNTKGHGLGLGYVKKIIALHNGHIIVESELNKGTKFIVSLPTK